MTRTILGTSLLWLASSTAMAGPVEVPADLQQPAVSYDGTQILSAAGNEMEQAVFYAPPGKRRIETDAQGMQMVAILREDLEVAWTILPQGMYVETSLAEADSRSIPSATQARAAIVEFEELGEDEVNGFASTKYRVVMQDDETRISGHFWLTDERIPVRFELTPASGEGTVTMQMMSLNIRDQDPALFELPAGAAAIPALGGLRGTPPPGDGQGTDGGFAGEVADEAVEGAKEGAKEAVNESVEERVKKGLKKLFGG